VLIEANSSLILIPNFIHVRDPLFTGAFRRMLRDFCVEPLKLPAQSPNLDSYAERFVLSIKSECLNKIILFSESQHCRAVGSYVEHYHLERPHQGLDNELIKKSASARYSVPTTGRLLNRDN